MRLSDSLSSCENGCTKSSATGGGEQRRQDLGVLVARMFEMQDAGWLGVVDERGTNELFSGHWGGWTAFWRVFVPGEREWWGAGAGAVA